MSLLKLIGDTAKKAEKRIPAQLDPRTIRTGKGVSQPILTGPIHREAGPSNIIPLMPEFIQDDSAFKDADAKKKRNTVLIVLLVVLVVASVAIYFITKNK